MNEKSADELAEIFSEYLEYMNVEIGKALKNNVDQETVEMMLQEKAKTSQDQFNTLKEVMADMGLKLKRVSDQLPKHNGDTITDAVRKGLEKNKASLKAMNSDAESKNSAYENSFAFKASGTMSITNNVTGEVPQALMIPGLNVLPSRQVRMLDVVTRGNISTNLVRWAYQANKDGSAGQTAEGSSKNQIDFDILTAEESVKKTTAFIKVTDEMIEDIDWMTTEINNELLRELLKAVEQGIYDGDGLTNNLHGVRDVAVAFSATGFNGTIDNANAVDVLTVAMNQIAIAEQGVANAIFMNPSDVTKLKMVKVSSTDKRYVERLSMVAGSLSLDGVPIIPTTLVALDDYLVGDFSRAFVLDRSDVNIEVGLDSDDFTKNLRTVRAEWRGVCYVKTNDRTAFVKGDFTTDAALLETP